MNISDKIAKAINGFNTYIGKAVAFLAIPMIISLVYEVFARYIFKSPTIWSYDVVYMLYGAHYLLGAAYTLRLKGHIRIDVFYNTMSKRTKAIVDIIGYLVIFFPIMIGVMFSTFQLALESYNIHELSVFTRWAPVLWPFKSIIFISFLLLCLQGISEVARSINDLMSGERS